MVSSTSQFDRSHFALWFSEVGWIFCLLSKRTSLVLIIWSYTFLSSPLLLDYVHCWVENGYHIFQHVVLSFLNTCVFGVCSLSHTKSLPLKYVCLTTISNWIRHIVPCAGHFDKFGYWTLKVENFFVLWAVVSAWPWPYRCMHVCYALVLIDTWTTIFVGRNRQICNMYDQMHHYTYLLQ